jgi:hypothetical protein
VMAAATNVSRPEDLSSSFSLDQVRYSLIRQEDSLIFSLIERAQFKRNKPVYEMDSEVIPVPLYDRHTGRRCSFLEYCLRENEQASGKMRRYTSPDEVAFYPGAREPPPPAPPLSTRGTPVPRVSASDLARLPTQHTRAVVVVATHECVHTAVVTA